MSTQTQTTKFESGTLIIFAENLYTFSHYDEDGFIVLEKIYDEDENGHLTNFGQLVITESDFARSGSLYRSETK